MPSIRDLPRLHNGQFYEWVFFPKYGGELELDVEFKKQVLNVAIREQFLVPFLAKMKAAGYTKVWIGTDNPHWRREMQCDMIVAEPRSEFGSSTSLLNIYRSFTNDWGCGNGLNEAEQIQGAGWLCFVAGTYDLR